MYCSWIWKICIFVTMINSQDKILQKTERMIYFHIMFMSASSIKRKSTLLLREATRSFIFRSATTFPGRKHLRENVLLCFRFEMLIRKWLLPEPNIPYIVRHNKSGKYYLDCKIICRFVCLAASACFDHNLFH